MLLTDPSWLLSLVIAGILSEAVQSVTSHVFIHDSDQGDLSVVGSSKTVVLTPHLRIIWSNMTSPKTGHAPLISEEVKLNPKSGLNFAVCCLPDINLVLSNEH